MIFKNENEVGKDTENTVYVPIPDQKRIYSYQSVHIYVSDSETATSSLNDSFSEDNTFEIYGGQKEVLKIQYASSLPNPFFSGILLVLQDNFSDRWDIQITEIHEGQPPRPSALRRKRAGRGQRREPPPSATKRKARNTSARKRRRFRAQKTPPKTGRDGN